MSFPECDALDLLQVLEALHLCTQVQKTHTALLDVLGIFSEIFVEYYF